MKEQIAKRLQDSGLFDWAESESRAYCNSCADYVDDSFNGPDDNSTCLNCGSEVYFELLPWLGADTSESILAELGLLTVWFEEYWHLTTLKRASTLVIMLYGGNYIGDIPKGKRTLANNAALAWLAESDEWRPKLEQALKKLGYLK